MRPGKVTAPAPPVFAGTLATRIRRAPPRDPEFKAMVERTNGYLETSFLPGRVSASPEDLNAQLGDWLTRANARKVRSIQGRPVDLLETDYQAMLLLVVHRQGPGRWVTEGLMRWASRTTREVVPLSRRVLRSRG